MEQTVVKQKPAVEAAVTPTRETAQKPKIKSPASKKRRKWIKRLIILAVLAALVVFLFKSCSGTGSIMAAGSYIPAVAARQELLVSVSGTGTIEPIHSYKVTTLIQGEVLEAPFEEGQTVHKGDLLFRIDSKDVEASIRQAELSLESARLNYSQLLKNQSDSQKNATVKATAAGVVTKLYVDQGDMVSAGAPIADILDRDNLKLTVPFHSVQAASISVGQQALVSVDGALDTLYGTVDSIAATVIGGTSLAGGTGLLSGTVAGAFLIGMLSNVMNILEINQFYQYVMKGALLIAAMVIYSISGRLEVRRRES